MFLNTSETLKTVKESFHDVMLIVFYLEIV